jgi:hypothetical protein
LNLFRKQKSSPWTPNSSIRAETRTSGSTHFEKAAKNSRKLAFYVEQGLLAEADDQWEISGLVTLM